MVNGAFVELTSSACRKNRDCGEGGSLLLGVLITRVTSVSSQEMLYCSPVSACCASTLMETPKLFHKLSQLNSCGNMERYEKCTMT